MAIDFKDGGAFVTDPNLDPKHIPGVLALFAAFVRFDDKDMKRTDWEKDSAVFSVIPSIFIDFAEGSRIDSGYRLLRRCVRHSMDSRTESLDNKEAVLVICNDKIGIHLKSPVPASMKQNIYNTEIVMTDEDLLCCQCDCQCGSKKEDSRKNLCVHALVVPYLLSILMAEDLPEHMRLELASLSLILEEGDGMWSDDIIAEMKQNALTLMRSAGNNTLTKLDAQEKTLGELLETFTVGTERQKEWNKRIKSCPKASEIGPIADMEFLSPEKKAAKTLKRENLEKLAPALIETFEPDYLQCAVVMKAAEIDMSHTGFVGYGLLDLRQKKQQADLGDSNSTIEHAVSITTMVSDSAKKWKLILRDGQERSVRQSKRQIENLSPGNACNNSDKRVMRSHAMGKSDGPPKPKQMLRRRGQDLPMKTISTKKAKLHKPRPHTWCIKVGCKVTNLNKPPGVRFYCIPPMPKLEITQLPPTATKKRSSCMLAKYCCVRN